jgi:hypothetical protein
MMPLGKWVVKEGFYLTKIIRIDKGEYLVGLPNGSNAITLAQIGNSEKKSAIYPSVVNGGYKDITCHGVQYLDVSPRKMVKILDSMGFLRKIDL